MTAKFSVVIPTFNRAKFLGLAIDSALDQLLKPYEVIVVDDGSVDHTGQVVASYRNRVAYIYQQNRGVSAARNRGILAARGDWVAFLDSDDEWLPAYLQKQAQMVARHPSAVATVMNSMAVAADGVETNSFGERRLDRFIGSGNELFVAKPFRAVADHHVTTLQSCAFRRDVLLSTSLFDEDLTIAEDWDVVAKMALKGPFVFCSEIQARIIRRNEDQSNLSAQMTTRRIETRLAWVHVLQRLCASKSLSAEERQALRRKLGANQRALGNLYLAAGDIQNARCAYRQAWHLDYSIASFARLGISHLVTQRR